MAGPDRFTKAGPDMSGPYVQAVGARHASGLSKLGFAKEQSGSSGKLRLGSWQNQSQQNGGFRLDSSMQHFLAVVAVVPTDGV
jgi:hypothetical protein